MIAVVRMGRILFDDTLAIGTHYIGVPVYGDGVIGLQIGWKDAISDAAITLELTSAPPEVAVADGDGSGGAEGEAWGWVDSGETITGPAATAAGAELVNVENVRQARARLVIVAAATTQLVVYDGAYGKQ